MSRFRPRGPHSSRESSSMGLAGALCLALALPSSAQSPDGTSTDGTSTSSATPITTVSIGKTDPALQSAEILPRASRSLLLDIVKTDTGFVAVGERGHILVSSDGLAWTQAQVPTRSTLTTLTAADGHLWAGGHDGVIVHSADGGQSWQRQRAAPWSAESTDPAHGVPILDLLFLDAKHGIAVGAFSLLLVTDDGGSTWTPKRISGSDLGAANSGQPEQSSQTEGDDWNFSSDELELQDESDPHFNAIARTESGGLVIVGERGAFFSSRDNGQTWRKSAFPYPGSMFGVLAWEGDRILAFGLRGHAYESSDLGATWRKVQTGTSASLMGGTTLAGDGAVLVGANGTLLKRPDSGSPFSVVTFENAAGETPVLSGISTVDEGRYVLISEKGVDIYLSK